MAATPQERSNITILPAEDAAPLRNLLQTIFENAGFTLLIAEDGQEAAHLAHGHEGIIDLLVSNVQMPNMTGPDLARSLRLARPELRVMLVSADPQVLLKPDTVWWLLQKPFGPKDIINKVHAAMAAPPTPMRDEG